MAVIGVILVFGILSFDLYGVIRNNIQKEEHVKDGIRPGQAEVRPEQGRSKAGQDKIQQR